MKLSLEGISPSQRLMALIFLLSTFIQTVPAEALGKYKCSPSVNSVALITDKGNASMSDAFWGSSQSLKSKTEVIFNSGIEKLSSIQSSKEYCPRVCMYPKQTQLVVTSTPEKTLSHYSGEEECGARLKETTKKPILFSQSFHELKDLLQWFGDLSRGRGNDGERLFKECPGKCSPRYSLSITKDEDLLFAKTKIVCGQARDKDNDMYGLISSLTWTCARSSGKY